VLKIHEIKNRISSELNSKFIQDGFKYIKSSNEFKCIVGHYTYFFSIDVLAWSDHYSVNVRLYVSEDRIEDVLEKILGKQRHRLTMGGDIGRIRFSPDGREVVNMSLSFILLFEKDISAAIETLYQYYLDIAKPFYTRYNSIETIDAIFNKEPFDIVPAHVHGTFDSRAMKGLILAKLVKNPRYGELIAIYNKQMPEIFKDFRQEAVENYYLVRDYLDKVNIALQ
jgi:hypothetical protein